MGPMLQQDTSFKGTGSCQRLTAREAGRRKHIHTHPQPRDCLADRGAGRGRLSMASATSQQPGGAGGARGAPSRLQACLLPSSATCTRMGQPSCVSAREATGVFGIHTGLKPRQKHSPTIWSPLASLVTAGRGGAGHLLPAPSPQQPGSRQMLSTQVPMGQVQSSSRAHHPHRNLHARQTFCSVSTPAGRDAPGRARMPGSPEAGGWGRGAPVCWPQQQC